MKYYIIYKAVFSKRSKEIQGYEMAVRTHVLPGKWDGFEILTIDSDKGSEEHARISNMLSYTYDKEDEVSFVDKHPVDILNYIRNKKKVMPMRTMEWEKDIDRWSVNLRGERV
ncbi:hypothetical protein [Salmonella phage SSBI34]|nr:hypothetical protein [Salmonella phage SSBI34]